MKKILILIAMGIMVSCSLKSQNDINMNAQKKTSDFEIQKSEEEWKKELDPVQYKILREKGTEYAFSGEYFNHKEKGTYLCAGCGNELFESDSKYDSGCGWPSFFEPMENTKILEFEDKSAGMVRTEIVCNKCGGHLGHVFPDGPKPTGLRYCVNSASLKFVTKENDSDDKDKKEKK